MLSLIGAGCWGSFPVTDLIKPHTPTQLCVDTCQLPSTMAIYLQVEPNAIINNRNFLLANWNKYKYILTFDDALLNLPNARKYLYGTTWIDPQDIQKIKVEDKIFQISSLTGSKGSTVGQRFRIDILNRQNFPLPATFYRSNTSPMTLTISDKIHLFRNFQYSLVIENSRQANYFTEKLCDCLVTKTIPVYYGAPNIHEYFDTTGWIILDTESVDTLLSKLAILTADSYKNHLDIVHKNYETVQQYLSFANNVNRVLASLPDY